MQYEEARIYMLDGKIRECTMRRVEQMNAYFEDDYELISPKKRGQIGFQAVAPRREYRIHHLRRIGECDGKAIYIEEPGEHQPQDK